MNRAIRNFAALGAALVVLCGSVRTTGPSATVTVSLGTEAAALDLRIFTDPIKYIWETFRDQVLGRIQAFITDRIEEGKRALQRLVDGAKSTLTKIFLEHVVQPGVKWAISKVFPGGEAGLQKVKNAIARFLGTVDGMVERVDGFADVALAIAEGSPTRLKSAQAKVFAVLEKLRNFNLQMVVDILMPLAREKVEGFVKSKAIELLERAWRLVETPIEMGKKAALTAIGTIPFVGGVLRGVVDYVLTEGINMLRQAAFDFIGNKAAELASSLLNQLESALRQGTGAVDAWLKPVYDTLRAQIDKAREMIAPLLSAYEGFKGLLAQLKDSLSDPEKLGKVLAAKIGGFLEEKLIEPALAAIRRPLDQAQSVAKQALQALEARVPVLFTEKVTVPALSSAWRELFDAGAHAERIVDDVAQSLAGQLDKVLEIDDAATKAMEGLLRKNPVLLAEAEGALNKRLDAIKKARDEQVIDAILSRTSKRFEILVRARVSDLLEKGYAALDGALDEIRAKAKAHLQSLPVLGSGLVGLADNLIQQRLRKLAAAGLETLSTSVPNLVSLATSQIASAAKGVAVPLAADLKQALGSLRSLAAKVRGRLDESGGAIRGLLAKITALKSNLRAAATDAAGRLGGGR